MTSNIPKRRGKAVTPKRLPDPVFESPQSAAARTGYSIYAIRQQIIEGRLPAYRLNDKPGSSLRVRVADVDALLTPYLPRPRRVDTRRPPWADREAN